jgi:hypothetical protein
MEDPFTGKALLSNSRELTDLQERQMAVNPAPLMKPRTETCISRATMLPQPQKGPLSSVVK